MDGLVYIMAKGKSYWKELFFILIILFLGLFLWQLDWLAITGQLSEVGWKFLWLIPINMGAYFFASLSWNSCLGNSGRKVRIGKLFIIRLIGESLALINPASIIAGDGVKHVMLKKSGISAEDSIASVLLSRAVIFISAIMLGFGTVIYLLLLHRLYAGTWLYFVVIPVFLFFLLFFWKLCTSSFLYLYKISRFFLRGFLSRSFFRQALQKCKTANQVMVDYTKKHPLHMVVAFVFAIIQWLLGAVEIWVIFQILSVDVGLFSSVVIEMGVVFIKNIGAFVPGQLGIEEFGNRAMIALIGITSPVLWITVSILRRTRQVFWIVVGAVLFTVYKY